ncbi:MAG: bifunctional folylpolyglutamate synthase/dihydrofolate synthase [Acidimicrobiia bacterium]
MSDIRAWLDDHINLETGVGAPKTGDAAAGMPLVAAPDASDSVSASLGSRSLDRMRRLLALLGSPERDFRAIHVAGTTGKTSTTRMLTELLRGAGLSVGTYTSPHLQAVEERIAYDGQPIESVELDGALELIRAIEPDLPEPPSFFEIITAAAFREFADFAVDVAVVEVGLGGAWDATNLVASELVTVTNISVDHTEYFGETVAEIARSEAEVVEPDAPLVLGVRDPVLAEPFLTHGAAPVLRRGAHFDARDTRLAHGGRVATLLSPREVYPDVFIALHGAHQADNAALALASAETFLAAALPDDVVREAFARVTSPGRLEPVAHQPLVLLDGAHNVAGCEALRDALQDDFPESQRVWVLGFLREKDPAEMLTALGIGANDAVVVCRPPSPRALDPEVVAAAVRALPNPPRVVLVEPRVEAAIDKARDGAPEDGQIVVTGSLYLVGAARSYLVPA